ncbi:hypothetical protein BH10PLA1_BH10PLA1_21920 [soil metagenome]
MRWVLMVALAAAIFGQPALADDIKPDQLKKMYDEAASQLNSAQDRINNLAMKNEQLTAQVAELQKQMAAASAKEATFADKTYQWRATFAAWELFLSKYPVLAGRWQAFMQGDVLDPANLPDAVESDWMLAAVKKDRGDSAANKSRLLRSVQINQPAHR